MNHNTFFSGINKVFFFIIFSFSTLLFFPAACDNGGGENNNNLTVDQDVKDWCAEWLFCSASWENIPWKTQEECEQTMQYIKKHREDSSVLEGCHISMFVEEVLQCEDINEEWAPYTSCSYTSFGVCVDGDVVEGTCPAVE